jgi:transcriptional regulator with XRE-family HTH domain
MLCLDQSPRTPSELRAALESRQLEQQQLAALVGVSERTIRRWCDCRAGDRPLRPTWRALVAMGLQAFDAMPRPEPEPPKEPEPEPEPEPATPPAAPRNRKRRFIPSGPIKPIYKTG